MQEVDHDGYQGKSNAISLYPIQPKQIVAWWWKIYWIAASISSPIFQQRSVTPDQIESVFEDKGEYL